MSLWQRPNDYIHLTNQSPYSCILPIDHSWEQVHCMPSFAYGRCLIDATHTHAVVMELVWEESERGRAVLLPSHLVRRFTLFFLVASHGRVPAAGFASQFNARPSYASEGASCPLGLQWSPGSWLGGSWVSALLISIVFLHLHWDLAVMSGWLVLLSARSFLNSSAHKLPILTEHVHWTEWLLFCFAFFFWCFAWFCVVVFSIAPRRGFWTA